MVNGAAFLTDKSANRLAHSSLPKIASVLLCVGQQNQEAKRVGLAKEKCSMYFWRHSILSYENFLPEKKWTKIWNLFARLKNNFSQNKKDLRISTFRDFMQNSMLLILFFVTSLFWIIKECKEESAGYLHWRNLPI